MGYFLLYEGMLESVLIARDKYLKNGGCLLPDRCLLHLVGISDSGLTHIFIKTFEKRKSIM